ncbi:MAG TPA: lysophospholipid acyltransferase family protein [Fluviicoccus sp.]|nr:lysophospholipid acyltransferase family protein [Fluviicoccus sp.]
MSSTIQRLPEATGELTRRDKIILGLLRRFSRLSLPTLQRIGRWLGIIASWFPGHNVWVIRRNLKICFPEKSDEWIEETVKQNLIVTGQTALEFAKTWGEPPSYSIEQIRKVTNGHLFFDALKSGKGVLALTPHYGTWEFMNAWLNQHAPAVIMYKPGKDRGVDTFVREARSRLSAQMVPTDERGVKQMLKCLKTGGFTIILPDHVPHQNGGLFAPFFGISTWSTALTPRLIQKTGCTVVGMTCTRLPNGEGFEIYFEAPHPDIYSQDLFTAASGMNHTMESLIRRDPTQYQWSYKRFKVCETLKDVYQ